MASKSRKETFSPNWVGFSPEEVQQMKDSRARLLKLIEEMSPEEKAKNGAKFEAQLKKFDKPQRVIQVTRENRQQVLRDLRNKATTAS